MPIYEYICEQDGTVLELRRSMAEADRPVQDPDGRGRSFTRKLSTFQAKSVGPATTSQPWSQAPCPCGKSHGGCGSN